MLFSYYIYIFITSMELAYYINGAAIFNKSATFTKNLSIYRIQKDSKSNGDGHIGIKSITDGDYQKNQHSKKREIIFPDSEESDSSDPESDPLIQISNTPNCASTDTFCENFDSYPHGYVENVLQKLTVDGEFFFGVDDTPLDLTGRGGGDEDDETFVCASVKRLIFPKIGKTRNDEWRYIVNQDTDSGFVQGIFVETCKSQGSPCDVIEELPNGFTTACKQKYVYRKLLSINDNGSPAPYTFQLPSACCCSYRRSMDFLARFGNRKSPANIKR